MKAAIYRRYGPPDVVQIDDVEKPVPKDNEVLIKVCAASVNPVDWHLIRGMPYMVRIFAGLRKPKMTGLGSDVAGKVEAVGRTVTGFKPGDAVFGLCRGTLAEYVCVSESALVRKPDNVTFEQAASVPVAALTALQGFGDEEEVQPWQKVLINGAAGGVGTFAVQIAKSFGAHVTGVCSTRNVEMVRSIGADRIIDYTQEDFTKGWQRYDVILDCVGNHSLSACRSVLTPKGKYIMVGGPTGRWMVRLLARAIKALVLSKFVKQKLVMFVTKESKENLTMMGELMEQGKVRPVIDRCYILSEVPEAIRYLEEGHARGKVVVTF
ncbi:MAG TPA: NAD(P)-dependent alcohol dehydrogenase [Candidatus Angelobacter sp.]|nr:NAD(P)-dependent alcohol dehydrogenase [Candidatus Angelobacter sp.]